jgi:hypothetical protein
MRPRFEVAQVLEQLGHQVNQLGLNGWQLRTLSAIESCRTAALGGHIDACSDCGIILLSYNSCRNRHCPKCQGHKREAWIQARRQDLLPVPYFHVVFTLPEQLNTLAMHQPRLVYNTLFGAAWQTLAGFGKQQGLQLGMVSILHTWGQNLSLHPHLHCVVPGGGVRKDGSWQPIRADGKFLYHVKALSKMFRAKYVAGLRAAGIADQPLFDALFSKPWVVYAKRPFGGPSQVVEYLGRYSHKIAISNHRLQQVGEGKVRFGYKDYRRQGRKRIMELTQLEFVRRFAQHILPKGFVRIRHYGFLSSTSKGRSLPELRYHLGVSTPTDTVVKSMHRCCPCCKKGILITIESFDLRGPPDWVLGGAKKSFPCAVA